MGTRPTSLLEGNMTQTLGFATLPAGFTTTPQVQTQSPTKNLMTAVSCSIMFFFIIIISVKASWKRTKMLLVLT